VVNISKAKIFSNLSTKDAAMREHVKNVCSLVLITMVLSFDGSEHISACFILSIENIILLVCENHSTPGVYLRTQDQG